MAKTYNAGTAYVQVIPSTQGIRAAMETEFSGSGKSAGSKFSSSFGQTIIGGAVMGVAASAASKVGNMFADGLNVGIQRADIMSTFPKVMKNLGYSADEASVSVKRLAQGVEGMPTALPDVVSLTQQFAPLCSSLDDATSLSLAFNNMLLAGGKSTQEQSAAMLQFTQALGRGKFEQREWYSLQAAMPAQLTQISKAMLGATANSDDLYNALKNGTVSMQDFTSAMMSMNQDSTGFVGWQNQAIDATQNIETAITTLGQSIGKFWQASIERIGVAKIAQKLTSLKTVINDFSQVVANAVGFVVDNFDAIKAAVAGLAVTIGTVKFAAFMQQINTGSNFLGNLAGKIGQITGKFDGIKGKLSEAANATKVFGGSAAQSSGNVGKLGDAASKTGQATGGAWKNMLSFGGAVLMIGAGIGVAAFGISTLAQGIATLSEHGAGAIATLLVIVGVIAGLGIALGIATPFISAAGTGMLIFGGACLMIGGAILLIGAGIMIMCQGIAMLAQQGPMALIVLVSLVGIIAGLIVVLALFAPVLTLCSAGLLMFGGACLMVGGAILLIGAGIFIACAGLSMMAATLPIIAAFGNVAAMGMMMMAGAATMLTASLLILPLQLGILMGVLLGFVAVVAGAAFAIGLSMLSFGAFADACQRAGDGMGTAMWAAENLAGAISNMANSARSTFDDFNSQLDNMANHAKTVCDQIRATFNTMDLHIPSPRLDAMPHFRLTGAFDLASGQVPRIDVDWYAKGGVFSSPSIIGVGDARSREIVTPEALMADIMESSLDKKQGKDAGAVISWLSSNLPSIIANSTPVMGEKTFDRKVRKAVAYA